VIPWLIASCHSNDGLFALTNESEDHASLNHVLGDDEDDDNDEDDPSSSLAVRTAFLDEKVSACDALGFISLYTGNAFAPFRKDVFDVSILHL
jgi:hypothetical protein